MKLVLASASPRRAEILRNAGFVFDVVFANIDETCLPGECARDYVQRLAEQKGRTVQDRLAWKHEHAIVLGADTAVVVGDQIFGKPASFEDARRMLALLSGRTHEVLTGLSLTRTADNQRASHLETTKVSFRSLSKLDIDYYLSTGEPFDKAGAYGIQGIGGRYVWRVEGCYFNVMGLPLSQLWEMLQQFGWENPGGRASES